MLSVLREFLNNQLKYWKMKKLYPSIFVDVMSFSPISGDKIIVSELVTYNYKNGITSTRDYQTILIDPDLLELINPDEINQATQTSTNTSYSGQHEYLPQLSVFVSHVKGLEETEPLVASWESVNHFSFQPDIRFLMTYGLTPRYTEDYIFWDDLRRPKYEVVKAKPVSIYNFPSYSESFVVIDKDYLQDYSALRKKVLVQVYQESRIVSPDAELNKILGKKGFYEKTTKSAYFRIQRLDIKEDCNIYAEVTGFRKLELPFLPLISVRHEKLKEHRWPGIDSPINRRSARHHEYGYVSDEVLDKYENDNDYEVHPESGSVQYKNQWSVSRSYRVGRNHIMFELFKFYEGLPLEVIDFWNRFAVDPNQIDKTSINIAQRAKRLVFSYLRFGELLSSVMTDINSNYKLSCSDVIGLDRSVLEYNGWHTLNDIKPITNHLKHILSEKDFLIRQKLLYKFLIEGLDEKNIRKTLIHLGVNIDRFKSSTKENFGSIKLLNLLLNYLSITYNSGLRLIEDSKEIVTRLENEKSESVLTKSLNALNSFRVLDSHKSDSSYEKILIRALKVFNIDKKGISKNFLDACENIYDKLSSEIDDVCSWLSLI
jgi:hypothetical protein